MAKKITEKDVKYIENNICFSTSFLAKILRVSSQTINNWEKQGCPKVTHGYWSAYDVMEWREEKYKNKNSGKDDPSKMNMYEQKIYYEVQLKKVQSEFQELKTAILNGDYLEKKDVVAELKRFFIVFKRAAYAMGKKVSAQMSTYVDEVDARLIDNLITDSINQSLEQLSEGDLIGKK